MVSKKPIAITRTSGHILAGHILQVKSLQFVLLRVHLRLHATKIA